MECTKCKDHAPPAPMAFRLRTVELPIDGDDGEPVTSAVLDPASYEPPPVVGQAGRGRNQVAARETLESLYRHHRGNLEAEERDHVGAKVTVTEWKNACLEVMDTKRFPEVKDSLLSQGHIRIEHGYVYLT
jgi:hypothetical protein